MYRRTFGIFYVEIEILFLSKIEWVIKITKIILIFNLNEKSKSVDYFVVAVRQYNKSTEKLRKIKK